MIEFLLEWANPFHPIALLTAGGLCCFGTLAVVVFLGVAMLMLRSQLGPG